MARKGRTLQIPVAVSKGAPCRVLVLNERRTILKTHLHSVHREQYSGLMVDQVRSSAAQRGQGFADFIRLRGVGMQLEGALKLFPGVGWIVALLVRHAQVVVKGGIFR